MMKRIAARTIVHRGVSEQQDFLAWSFAAMWGVAAVYLLATFTPY